MAVLEALPLLVIFLVLISYGLGLWGVVHAGVLHSIAARTYAFETFRNRTDLSYFRDSSREGSVLSYERFGMRFHGVQSPGSPSDFHATAVPLAIGREVERSAASLPDHNQRIYTLGPRNREGGVEVSPAWLMIGYGMCLNAVCGGSNER